MSLTPCFVQFNIFKENVVGSTLSEQVGKGGGIGTYGEGWVIVEDCIFNSNSAGHGAGAYFSHHSGRFVRNKVINNEAFGASDGYYCFGGSGGGIVIVIMKENFSFIVCFNIFKENKCT